MTRDPRTGRLVPDRFTVVTPAISLARQLWRYGEPGLAERALELPPADVADVCVRASAFVDDGTCDRVWPTGPGFTRSALVLASIEWFEGALRPPARNRRLPEKKLPPTMELDEAEGWKAVAVVSAEIDNRR